MDFIPLDVQNAIEAKSKRDCVNMAPSANIPPSSIPKSLVQILNNDLKFESTMAPASYYYERLLCSLSNFTGWNSDIYWYLWKLLLFIEYHQSVKNMDQYTLHNQKLVSSKRHKTEYQLTVAGLLEDRPSLKENDYIVLTNVNGSDSCEGQITFVGKDYISFEVPAEFKKRLNDNQKFNVRFKCNTWTVDALNDILNDVYKNHVSPMLFPHKNDSPRCTLEAPIGWINKNIETNPEQQQAIRNILKKSSQPAPYILFGPPGTGKTSTLVEAISQIMIKHSSSKILICTPSNSAADEIVERLTKNPGFPINHDTIYRMYSASRSVDNVKAELRIYSNFADTETIYESKEVFITKKIVVTTLTTCIRLHFYKLRPDHFSYLFIDEAGQATELETLIPFTLMCGTDSKNECKISAQIVIAGDPKQLGPSVQSKLAEPILQISMLERLMSWGPYLKNSNDNKYDPIYVTKLIQNYRSHKTILEVPNNLFYDGELVAVGGSHTTKAINWSGLPKKNIPVIFHAVKGKEVRRPHSPSVCNQLEVRIVVDYVMKLIKTKFRGAPMSSNDIGIVTPFRLQRSEIHQGLQAKGLNKVSVGTVEAFQGQERDVIIISTVRSTVFLNDNGYHIGFLSNPKRFNVALTRAKALLIVIGHPEVLQQDPCWREFIQYCYDNKLCLGDPFDLNPRLDQLNVRKNANKSSNWEGKANSKAQNLNNMRNVEGTSSTSNQEQEHVRRRRRPIGPLPEVIIDSKNTIGDGSSDALIDNEEWYESSVFDDDDYRDDDEDDDDYHDDDIDSVSIDEYELENGQGEVINDNHLLDNSTFNYFENYKIDGFDFGDELMKKFRKLGKS